ncbi:PilZ domain-containing protein [Novosphingobium sp. 9U]|uniref:PilZ domain-containing protein n=1 Tax=Novosphingobium sp. 9U TaxID=2653158 RepID=UPI0012F2FF57|nr:PilZ domain-containing protein [Novosphingobium sp. 9U]VWX52171.1 PilZ domain-containing protein [Novosphingobium sp. 9U]
MIFHRQRGEERTRIAVEARMRIGEFEGEAMLLNASSRGVLAALAQPPVRGTRVTLIVGEMELVGQVRWRGTDCCGIALRDPISVADLLEGHAVPVAFIPEPRALRGIGGMLRALVGERSALRFQ